MKDSPLRGWLFLLAATLVGAAWMAQRDGPDSPLHSYALLSGGLGSGMLIAMGLTGLRWAKGQRAFAKKSAKEKSEKSQFARSASLSGCVGCLLALVSLLSGLAVVAYMVVTLR